MNRKEKVGVGQRRRWKRRKKWKKREGEREIHIYLHIERGGKEIEHFLQGAEEK